MKIQVQAYNTIQYNKTIIQVTYIKVTHYDEAKLVFHLYSCK